MPDPDQQKSIVVVSGLPRSGTSLMMQILEAAGIPILTDPTREPDPSNPNGYYELDAVKGTARDAAWLATAPGHAVKVIHALLPHLPNPYRYKVLLMQRDVKEVVTSQNQMLEALGDDQPPLPDGRLEAIFEQQMNETRQRLDREAHFDWIEVAHAGLFHDAERELQCVQSFLGLSGDIKTLLAAIDPALYRTRLSPIPAESRA